MTARASAVRDSSRARGAALGPARPRVARPRGALLPAILACAGLAGAALLAAPGAAHAQSPCGAGYTVRTGDTLLEIAERCGITVPALLAVNPAVRDELDLEVGHRLRVPTAGTPAPSPRDACGPYYTIRTGDTLAEIAEKCGLTIPLLVAANGPLPDPLGLHDGARIRIPDLPEPAVRDPATLAIPPAARATRTATAEGEPTAEAGAEVEADVEAGADVHAEADAGGGTDPEPEMVRVEGVLRDGPRCPVVQRAGGETVALAGEVAAAFRPGDRVVALGFPAGQDACGHAPALELRILYRAPGGYW